MVNIGMSRWKTAENDTTAVISEDEISIGKITINQMGIFFDGTICANPLRADYIEAGSIEAGEGPKHFNCKKCGAPNQIDVCEYCGSIAEGR